MVSKGRKPKSESQLICKGKKRPQKVLNFQRQIKEVKAPVGIFRMGLHRKFLSRTQEEMGIQSFLVGVRREFGFTEEPAKFTMSYPGSVINLFNSGENSCRKRILIFKKAPGRLEHKPVG